MTHPDRPAYPNHLNNEAGTALMAALPESTQIKINDTTYPQMVNELAKPGETIRDELQITGFITLLRVCAAVINRGNELDTVKKNVVYNKVVPDAPLFLLPSSQPLGAAFEALTAEKAHLLHMAVGHAGEAAEMLYQIVQHVLGAPLDHDNVVEESGDSTFYIQGLLGPLGYSLQDALFANKVKLLGKRFPNGYSDAAAQERADKPAGE